MAGKAQYRTNPEEFQKFHSLISAGNKFLPFYFPLMRGGKDPLENVSWKNNRKTPQEAVNLMRRGFNIGVAATKESPLVIIDVDDMTQVPEIKPTLQSISRKRIGRHSYFFAKDETAKRNIAADTAGEVRAVWQYVVAPGSFVECSEEEIARMPEEEKVNAGKYTVGNNLAVSEITYNEFPEVYKEAARKREIVDAKSTITHLTRKPVNKASSKGKSALWDLTITDVSGLYNTNGKRVPMPSEIHGSETGKNCSVSQGLLHCWRHEVVHNAFSYLAVCAGIMSCEQAGMKHNGRYFGADSRDGETVFKVWKYAKDHHIIPSNDPIPQSALIYYAIEKGICEQEDTREGKLPDLEYKITITIAKKEGFDFGRKCSI